jgi:cytochrome c
VIDTFELNKMAGAFLGTLLFTMSLAVISDAIFSHPKLIKPGYDLPSAQPAGASEGKPAPTEPLPQLLAKADPTKGQADTKPCQACHNFEKGAGVKIGPPLYGVVGRPRGSVPGFGYSAAMKAKGGNWTFEDIFTFISDPQAFVPGTKMTFSGEPDPHKRADIVAYLRTLSDNPLPLPEVAAPAAPAPPLASPPAGAKPPAAAAAPAPAAMPAAAAASPPATAPPAPAATPPAPAPAANPPPT